ncbi:type III polyketide synthase [Mucilaginibacter phyllosphaerae]|uniref:Alkylresorcinol/alkylpyrone synthase n=1 Tax=Mucilaginibacter phyllosphaerae TaxID=1812349 RepID=A0A4Y8AJ77_9SPHI|nr:3-oxoacyl-[acyl-carrier-protein] synthase III C-terminal domain-containing protein [Mucilaginibacter phyllosphaerae]MBB3967875.1 alkylresorcinol/alkylpyrone synthase [Mucilaginibacter phyllosphaerae]TEW69083.1 type III polyketide synthase [Mucilaginibacter phyllosphaerae]GGH02734.1 putative chalcone synthase [Mucilaginibacter phyllosphaerae]
MPHIAAVTKINLPDKTGQQAVKEQAYAMFSKNFAQAGRLMPAFDNTGIVTRNFVKPLSYYAQATTFKQRNDEYIKLSLQHAVTAVEAVIAKADINKNDITDLIFISTTGLATPSIDALIINQMELNPHINRMPVWGLGCAGGVSGMAKANMAAQANPNAVVLLVAVELCSLTLIKSDYSKSNFIGSSLFSDGVAACIVKGDQHQLPKQQINIKATSSKLYYNSLDVMGWDFKEDGFKVVFSKDIPAFIHQHIGKDIEAFLGKQGLKLGDIKNFIFHPGGKKVLDAYADALNIAGDFLQNTREVMNDNGNMSSVTVLYVLERFMETGFTDGYGLMLAMGPGFSSEMVLLDLKN